MDRGARILVVALMSLVTACSKPYSVLDKTEWINIERGIHLSIGTGGSASIENEAAAIEPATLTYAIDTTDPQIFVFKNASNKKVLLHAQLPGYLPPGEGEKAQRPEKMDKLVVSAFGDQMEFVSDTAENRKAYDEQVAFARDQAKKLSIAGAPHDPSSYVDVVKQYGPNWATYYVLSQSVRKIEDEDKLGMLSSKWNSTSDSFARHAMKNSELATINANIASIVKTAYVALPLDILGGAFWVGLNTSAGYDFERKGFPLTGSLCGEAATRNKNGVTVQVSPKFGADVCFLPVPDQNVAQQVERVRTAVGGGTDGIKGMAFYKLGPVRGNSVSLLPVGAHAIVGDFFLKKDNAPIYTTTIWGMERKQR